jgi:hypothetical protein
VHLRFLARSLCPDQFRYLLTRLGQSVYNRRRISLVGFLQRHRQHRSGFQIYGMLGFVRQANSQGQSTNSGSGK